MSVKLRLPSLCCRAVMAALLVTGLAAPGSLGAASAGPDLEGQVLKSTARGGPLATRGPVDVMVELTGAPAAQVYAQTAGPSRTGISGGQKASVAAVKSQVEANAAAQQAVVTRATALGARILFRTQRVYNGVAMRIEASQMAQLKSLPGVRAVRLMIPKEMDHTSSVPFIGAPAAWVKGLGYRGQGIKVGVIDTGIDYLHTNNGGPGTGYGANNTTVVGDVPNFPGVKVAGGYDFAGDAYDANTNPVPAPDSDPMDCNGHGSHVAGSVGGYGVNADGTTYPGPWGDGSPFSSMRIGPGVAPEVTLYGLRVFGCGGSTNLVSQALEWAVDPNGDGDFSDRLDVVNMSLGSSFGSPEDDSAVAAENAAAVGVIVVASAGNAGDTYFISGSPGISARTISVASSKDALITADALEVLAPPAIAGLKPAFEASFGPNLATHGDVTGDLQYASPTNGCTALTGFTAGRIALIDRGTCSFKTKVLSAQNALASAVVIVNNVAGPPAGMGDDPTIIVPITIPSVMISLADGNDIKTQLALPTTVTARLSADLRGQGTLTDIADDVSSFTSRGPSRAGALKPDVSSIGDTVYSTAALSGTYGTSLNGTSMAAPHVAGSMALLKQIHPTWSVNELKALIMNSANHNVNQSAAPCSVVTPCVVGAGRVGAGRQDVANAVNGNVVAYVNDSSGRISASFGVLDVTEPTNVTRTVTVANKGGKSATFNLAYVAQANAAGVTVTTSVPSITVPAGGSGTFNVVLAADPVAMKHDRDSSVAASQVTGAGTLPRAWLTEEAGFVSLTPVTGAPLRVPVHAMPRPAAVMGTTTDGFNISSGTGVANVTLTGDDVATGPTFPNDVISLASVFELQDVSPEILPGPGPDDSADLQYVGVMAAGIRLEFGIATHGDFSTVNDTEFDVYIDVNRDGTYDWVLFNTNLGTAFGNNAVDVPYTLACTLPAGVCQIARPVNMITPNSLDTVFFNTNVMVLGVTTSVLGLSGPFNYYVETFNRDNAGVVDLSAVHTYDPAAPGLSVGSDVIANTSFWTDLEGTVVPVTYNLANYIANDSAGLLILHHHNVSGNRGQVLTVDTQVARGDFGSGPAAPGPDGWSDLVLQNNSTGEVAVFFMNGNAATGSAFVTPAPAAGDKVVGTADFNADGSPDLLFVNATTGDVKVWYMNGVIRTSEVPLNPGNIGTDWKIVGTGHFNGDASPDLVFRQTSTGHVAMWFMNGVNLIGGGFTVPQTMPASWQLTTGDLNNDGTTDLVWQNTAPSGELAVWFMSGLNATGSSYLNPSAINPDWKVRAIGKFTSDNDPDIFFHSTSTGAFGLWYMDGINMTASVGVTPPGISGYTVVGPR